MKVFLTKVISNKYFKLFLPIIIFLAIRIVEFFVAKLFGNKNGFILNSSFIYVKSTFLVIAIYWFIFNIFYFVFKAEKKVVLFNLGFLIVTLYSIEFFLKKNDIFLKSAFDSNYYYSNKDKYEHFITPPQKYLKDSLYTWGHLTKRNWRGFRDSEIKPKPKGVFRIMVLGDSFTWGAGLADNEMYSNILDSSLKAFFHTDSIEVSNCAYSGSPTIAERDLLRELKDSVKPDLIVVGFCVNDPQPKSEDFSIEKYAFENKWGSKINKVKNCFYKLKLYFFGDLMANFLYKMGTFPSFEVALGRVYDKKSNEWKNFNKALIDIKNISDSLNCPKPVIGVFSQVGFTQLKKTVYSAGDKNLMDTKRSWLNQVYETAIQCGFTAINFVPILDNEVKNNIVNENNIMVHPLDGHPGPILNRMYAREFFNVIKPVIQARMDSLNQKNH